MPTEQTNSSNPRIDTKHATLIIFVLIGIIVSSVSLGLQLTWKQSLVEDAAADTEELSNESPTLPAPEEPEFTGLLEKKSYYSLPFGAAEIEAYYTKVEKATTLDDSGPTVTCSALVIVDGPKMLMDSLKETKFGTPPTVIIGSEDSNWTGINESTKSNPVKLLVTLGSMFEGEAVGCMSVVFDTLTVIE